MGYKAAQEKRVIKFCPTSMSTLTLSHVMDSYQTENISACCTVVAECRWIDMTSKLLFFYLAIAKR